MTVWINALYESQGQAIIENPEAPAAETQLSLDTEAGAEAARIVGTIGSEGLAGPGATTQDENVAMAQFQGEQGSFMVNWPFVYSATQADRKSTRLNSSHVAISYAVFCMKKKK